MDKLDTMRAFTYVVQESSFSKAADKLDMSPQLVSKYVSNLEDELKTRLLHRTTRKVSITEAGRAYYDRCIQVLDDIDEMENALNDLHQHVSGVLSISAPMSFGMRHLPVLIADFQRQYPDVHVDLRLTDKKVDIVEEGVDIALRIGNLRDSALIARRITDIKLAICASPNYLSEKGVPQTPKDLSGHEYLRYSYSESLLMQLIEGLGQEKIELVEKQSCNNGDYLLQSAIHGGGIIIQPTFIVGDALSKGQLVPILSEYAPSTMGLYAVYSHRKFLASKVRAFIDFTSEYYGETPYWDLFDEDKK